MAEEMFHVKHSEKLIKLQRLMEMPYLIMIFSSTLMVITEVSLKEYFLALIWMISVIAWIKGWRAQISFNKSELEVVDRYEKVSKVCDRIIAQHQQKDGGDLNGI